MPKIARLGDRTQGICSHPTHSPPISTGGTIITSSGTVYSENMKNARLGDEVQTDCGHTGFIISSSGTVYDNAQKVARLGDLVGAGAPYDATIVTRSSKVSAGD